MFKQSTVLNSRLWISLADCFVV